MERVTAEAGLRTMSGEYGDHRRHRVLKDKVRAVSVWGWQ